MARARRRHRASSPSRASGSLSWLPPPDPTVDTACCDLRAAHRFDHCGATVGRVSGGEILRVRRLAGLRIDLETPVLELEVRNQGEQFGAGPLADRLHGCGHWEEKVGSGHLLGLASAARIRLAEPAAPTEDAL